MEEKFFMSFLYNYLGDFAAKMFRFCFVLVLHVIGWSLTSGFLGSSFETCFAHFPGLHQIAPYASVIVNGLYWHPNQPRLLTNKDAKSILRQQSVSGHDNPGEPPLPHRLLAICDISADLNVSNGHSGFANFAGFSSFFLWIHHVFSSSRT